MCRWNLNPVHGPYGYEEAEKAYAPYDRLQHPDLETRAALGVQAGGRIETDPADPDGLRTLQPVAVIDVQVPDLAVQRLGARLLVRFDHGPQPLGARWLRRLQQLMLRHLGEATDVPGGR